MFGYNFVWFHKMLYTYNCQKLSVKSFKMLEVICEGIHSHIVSNNLVSYPDHIGGMKSGLGTRPQCGLGMRPIKILQKPVKTKN